MKEVNVTMWEITPTEAKALPPQTQLIEYGRVTQRLAIRRSDHCLYDDLCTYLLAKNPAELSRSKDNHKNRSGEKPKQ